MDEGSRKQEVIQTKVYLLTPGIMPGSCLYLEKKKGKITKIILVGLGIGFIVIAGLFMVLIYFFFWGGPVQITKDASAYEETMHKYTQEVVGKVHTGFFAFPEIIPQSALENEPIFYFSYQDTWDDPTCEVYLKCTYSDDDYSKEIDRLKNSRFQIENAGQTIYNSLEYEDSGRFDYPVYKAIDCDNHSYEYAMDLGNNEIAYIYTSFKSLPGSLKSIPRDYLPEDYKESIDKNTYSNGGYNVYVAEKTDEYTSYDYGDRFSRH